MPTNIKTIFFGSTTDSVIVLNQLFSSSIVNCNVSICCVVTQPPRPAGRDKIITPTPVEILAKEHAIPVVSFASNKEKNWLYENEHTVIDTLEPFKADLIISASYGVKIPKKTISDAQFGGLNIHPSVLPRWRGADPVPWAIIADDRQIGVTVVTLSETFDTGIIVAQKKIPLTKADTSDPIRSKLFQLGAKLLIDSLPNYLSDTHAKPVTRNQQPHSYARKFTREDGYIPWELMQAALNNELGIKNKELGIENKFINNILTQYTDAPIIRDYLKFRNPEASEISLGEILERFFRALSPWPGMWTTIGIRNTELGIRKEIRMKIIKLSMNNSQMIIDTVQLEGKKPMPFMQYVEAYKDRIVSS